MPRILPDPNVPTSVRESGVPVVHGSTTDLGPALDTWLAELDGAPAARPKSAPQNAQPARPKAAPPNVAAQKPKAPVRQSRPVAPPQARVAAPAPARAPAQPSITDTQVLRILEERVETPAQDRSQQDAHTAISLLKPEDTGTRRALREAVTENRPVAFAVQLQWSVQPIDINKLPPLAIFSALRAGPAGAPLWL